MSDTTNWADPKIIRDPGESDDNLLKRMLAQSTFYLCDEKFEFPMKVWWKPSKYKKSFSSWELQPPYILNQVDSRHLPNSTVQMEEVIAMFGGQIPEWMRMNLSQSDKDLVQRTVYSTPGDLMNAAIEAHARRQGVAVKDLEARIVQAMQVNPDLASSFVKSVMDSDDSTNRPDDTSKYSSAGSMSIVTIRTA